MCRRLIPLFVALAIALPTTRALAADELDAYSKAIEEHPEEAKSYEAYANAALARNRLDDAITRLKLGVARLSEFPRGYYLLAYAYNKKQMYSDSAAYFRTYIVLRPGEFDSYYRLGYALVGMNEKGAAIVAFKKYLSLEKRPTHQKFVDDTNAQLVKLEPPAVVAPSASAGQLKAECDRLKNEQKWPDAELACRKAIDADKGNLDLYNNLGNIFFTQKKYNDAAAAFKEAVAKDGSFALGWYNLAHALRKADRKAEAVEAYKKYMKLKPEDPDPYYGMAQTLKQLGDMAGAVVSFRKYVDMEKRPAEQKWVEKARQELAAIEAQLGTSAPTSTGKISDDK